MIPSISGSNAINSSDLYSSRSESSQPPFAQHQTQPVTAYNRDNFLIEGLRQDTLSTHNFIEYNSMSTHQISRPTSSLSNRLISA